MAAVAVVTFAAVSGLSHAAIGFIGVYSLVLTCMTPHLILAWTFPTFEFGANDDE